MSETLLEMNKITKRFPGVYALQSVDFELRAGEVHALLGENGAGKSTLMKVLGGIHTPDEGKIHINGNEVSILDVKDAQQHGISIIHQEIVLVPYLSIAENIYLGREILNKAGLIDLDKMVENSQEFLRDFKLEIDARTHIKKLTVAQQQMIEIIKAVSFESKIIVMDEPTSSLTDREVDFLFKTIENLKKKGVGIVYISHRMNELFEISDMITVMRDGSYIGTVKTKEATNDQLISMMVGRELTNYYDRSYSSSTDDAVMEVINLSKKGILHDINFKLRKGEILGFSGLVGAGRSELMKCLFGIDTFERGEVSVNGVKIVIKNPSHAIKNNIAYVPENRKEEGLFLSKPVNYNITIKILHQFIKFFRVDNYYEDNEVRNYIEELSIRTPSPYQVVRNLSGGNQQKVLISRWLATKPKILILDEPTRGVDVGAKAEIYSIMNRLSKEGVSIIMISSELPEIMNMSDRVAVMYKGKIQKILDRESYSQEKIMYYATGGI
ncbi:ATP-binding cassette domain-containing protein [Aquibacillus halophilus]|uniref:ATP-binding cassette domain-containing protein n=1 Tax=Aquibacillus halophilus TaxID=930132 RepID=A0A6A8DC64_9BACI|nr:sugar ABC transporter ATP-binding protein [Aquibacillus halophilus]MRH41459.1 ATP-binding cassette domain-containing protein [Aquibacillus halophilus]